MNPLFPPPFALASRLPTVLPIALFLTLLAAFTPTAQARSTRVGLMPNGQVFGCANCHLNPSGGGARNAFGQAVGAITGSNPFAPFWSASLAAQDSDGDTFANGEELGDPDGDGIPTPGATVTNPGSASSKPVIPPSDLEAPVIDSSGQFATLSWSGGRSPFLIQEKSSLTDTTWRDVRTTTNRTASVALVGPNGFFRITENAAVPVTAFTVSLSGAAEIPAVDTPGSGFGTLSLSGNQLTYDIPFRDLSAPATTAHIHGPASPTQSANPMVTLQGATGTSGTLSGTVDLTDPQKADVLDGRTYVNIHTGTHTGGEIRGQIELQPLP